MALASSTPAGGLLNLERELQCFICTELLFQPLTLIDCLHTFCGSCLKEWFGHQYKKATHSRSSTTSKPYTCPTCRATVKDARHNATVTTLLDMFLTANPSRSRTAEEQAEASQTYKPGEDILPKVEAHRRRDRRGRREGDDVEAQERRLIEEARQRSLRDLEAQGNRLVIPNGSHPSSRSRDRDERRERRREQDRSERRRRVEAAEEAHALEQASLSSRTAEITNLSPPARSPRHPESVEARQRDRTIAHQSSLISLMSASESGTGTGDSLNEARIMQEILAEGLLEGINVDELTEQEQDELSERIAEAYRQRHQNRRQQSPPQDTADTNGDPPVLRAVPRTRPESDSITGRQIRSHSHQPSSTGDSRTRNDSPDSRRPPASRPHLLQVTNSSTTTTTSSAHRRRASDQTRRQPSPSRPSSRPGRTEPGQPATRSATDLSSHPTSGIIFQGGRPRQFSEAGRTNTDPTQSMPKASEIWKQGRRGSPPARPTEQSSTIVPVAALQTETSGPAPPSENLVAATQTLSADLRPHTSDGVPVSVAQSSLYAAAPSLQVQTRFEEPSITCARCKRPEIQYDLYKHCSPCNLDLCLRCFRDGRGCNHWYGFGYAANAKFEAARRTSRNTQAMDPPHVLVGRRYQEPPPYTIQAPGIPNRTTTSNPAERLEEGKFCDRCRSFANASFWSCDYCNDGEWGFCNNCVNTHKCCVHPLLPLAHRAFAPKSPSQAELGYDPHTGTIALTPSDLHAAIILTPDHSRPSTANSDSQPELHSDYVPLKFTATCDICHQDIPTAHSHFHCPSHAGAPNTGDYDVCVSCYHNLIKSGRIKRDDGPAGWRKCLSGHRMIMIGFEVDEHSENQRRVIINDLVGGQKMTDEDMTAWRTKASSSNADPAQSTSAAVLSTYSGWAWREDGKKATISRAATLKSSNSSKFPPDGGFGKTFVAQWSRYPAEGEEGKDEILFPRGAEVCEVEEINEDWKYGVYMGELGFFPAGFVREV